MAKNDPRCKGCLSLRGITPCPRIPYYRNGAGIQQDGTPKDPSCFTKAVSIPKKSDPSQPITQ